MISDIDYLQTQTKWICLTMQLTGGRILTVSACLTRSET